MDPINIQYSLGILGHESAAESGAGAGPSVADLDRFQVSMQEPLATPVNPSEGAAIQLGVDHSNSTMGDKILQGLQNLKTGYDQQIGSVNASLTGPNVLDVKGMFKLQLDLAKLTLQGELINKTVSKSTQNLDTLLKSQ